MTKKNVIGEVTAKPKSGRRKFLKTGAVGAVGAATVAFPMVSFAQTRVLKMQAAWGGGIFLENAKSYVDRVNAMAGKDLKIDLLAVNAVVKTSQMQDAVHRGVLDAAHYVPAYWYSKSTAASLFGTGPCFGWSSQEVLGWVYYGGGQELFDELMGSLGLNVVSFFNSPMPAQPLGWFKEEIKSSAQMKGLKYRTVGLAADVMLEMGMSVVQLPGGEIQPAMKSGLIDAAEFNNPTSDRDFGMQDVSKHYHLASFHQSQERSLPGPVPRGSAPARSLPRRQSLRPTIHTAATFSCGKPPRLWVRHKSTSSRWRSAARPSSCRYIS